MSGDLCIVIMPFGRKGDARGAVIDFDDIYLRIVRPAVLEVGLQPIRADEEASGGFVQESFVEKLALCDYALVDLTTQNLNVIYGLGVRHATRPQESTVILFAKGSQLPLDVCALHAIAYTPTARGTPDDALSLSRSLVAQLSKARRQVESGMASAAAFAVPDQTLASQRAASFRGRVDDSLRFKARLTEARRSGLSAVQAVEQELGNIAQADAEVVIDLFHSYRAVRGWGEMINLVKRMASSLAASVEVQQQLALALNRVGAGEEAEAVLRKLLDARGPSSETYGILGRVYKDRWEAAGKSPGGEYLAASLLEKAIDAYVRGFETDWRDAYPGVNAVTLMELKDTGDPRQQQLLPVVRYAVERRVATAQADYWDHATRLELAVLARDGKAAESALEDVFKSGPEPWQAETTVRNLGLIREARQCRGETLPWANSIEHNLRGKAEM